MNIFTPQRCIKLIKSDSEDIYSIILNKCCIHKTYKVTKTVSNIVRAIINNRAAIIIDFWRSCDIEDWRNDAENTALRHRKYMIFYNIFKQKSEFLL